MLSQIISFLTFPGIIAHEFGHELFCNIVGVRVRKVCYFRWGNPAGYVVHDQSIYFYQAFFIACGPYLSGTILSFLFFVLSMRGNILSMKIIWLWLGISVAFNCLPSTGDAKTLWQENWNHIRHNILSVVWLPFTIIVWLLSKLNSFWFGFLYAGLVYGFAVFWQL